jgi:hypothetical protein
VEKHASLYKFKVGKAKSTISSFDAFLEQLR